MPWNGPSPAAATDFSRSEPSWKSVMAFSDALRARSLCSVLSKSWRAPSLRVLTSSATASASKVANRSSTASVPPALEVGRDKGIVVQLGIDGIESIDAGALSGTERLVRIEAFDRGHQPLPPQDLVAARDATGEIVIDVEDHAVAVGDERIQRQHLRRNGAGRHRKLQALQHLYRAPRPHAPVPQQPTLETQGHLAIAGAHHHRRHQVGHDVVVVAGIEG